jgi:ATP-dependent helicase Lhr and Lhr-like helicase
MLLRWGDDTLLFPWAGDRVLGTIAIALTSRGLEVSQDGGVALTVTKSTPEEVRTQLEALLARPPGPEVLATAVQNKRVEKYDWALSYQLLNTTYAARSLDPAGAWHAVGRILSRTEQARSTS